MNVDRIVDFITTTSFHGLVGLDMLYSSISLVIKCTDLVDIILMLSLTGVVVFLNLRWVYRHQKSIMGFIKGD